MKICRGFRSACLALAMLLCVSTASAGAMSQEQPKDAWARGESANELVRRVVRKGLNDDEGGPRYMFRLRRISKDRSTTKDIVETPQGLVARLVSVNGRPLTAEEERAEEEKLESIVHDPEFQAARKKEQDEDEERVKRLVRALPDAFLYEYQGREPGTTGMLLRLSFQPNPAFDPPHRETEVYRGMRGKLWIDAGAERMLRMEGELFRRVNFGWGILGHLDPGGRFVVTQTPLAEGRWEINRIRLRVTGTVLFFKKIDVDLLQVLDQFERVPADLSLAQAVKLLRARPAMVAGNVAEAGR